MGRRRQDFKTMAELGRNARAVKTLGIVCCARGTCVSTKKTADTFYRLLATLGSWVVEGGWAGEDENRGERLLEHPYYIHPHTRTHARTHTSAQTHARTRYNKRTFDIEYPPPHITPPSSSSLNFSLPVVCVCVCILLTTSALDLWRYSYILLSQDLFMDRFDPRSRCARIQSSANWYYIIIILCGKNTFKVFRAPCCESLARDLSETRTSTSWTSRRRLTIVVSNAITIRHRRFEDEKKNDARTKTKTLTGQPSENPVKKLQRRTVWRYIAVYRVNA